ncbi:deoxyguanosinetriphosphate triphosphohydrolase [Pseudonocardia sp. HH130630-07]|uniref:deoxyguanosinetriphosphate triphosphohydrolase n=1 Tax=Pseudonocardia sp. HH130630-07 TaxID=1690815 RepID=UPI0008150961|nr:deoxyguanosinetriphosphate triphosphohydrolase [Pseudonocardia sp. HH130630-07]ANY05382.1 deoxyguanosinetriphosphate triphosphohydrolase [Pseudonocardia sp. HH130630-07]
MSGPAVPVLTGAPGYEPADVERRHPEPPKGAGLGERGRVERRSPFSRDRARVLHSAALRRLAGKTQVVGPGEGAEITGMPRTRLTHSLEVAQIGRGIAEELGLDPDVVDAAGLAHDIGHPPFGHNGERALDEAAGACGGFEGNAQTLRILTRLEPKRVPGGLNLTRATLDASTKYPWPRRGAERKFGAYPDDVGALEWVRAGARPGLRSMEAQVMDWADDVAYSVHDVEDAILAGRMDLAVLSSPAERAALAGEAAVGFGADAGACAEAAARLDALPVVRALRGFDVRTATGGDLVAMKRMTSELVGRFALAATDATLDTHGDAPLARHRADLVVPVAAGAEVVLLKALATRYVMSDPQRLAMQARQRELLHELVATLTRLGAGGLDPVRAQDWAAAPDDRARLRVVVDQVALLTDPQAVARHRELCRSGVSAG